MTTQFTESIADGDYESVEGYVTEVWRRMLSVDDVARDAEFGSLGGDSLLLLSIMTEIEEKYDIELDVDTVIEDLTVAGMAKAVVATLGS